MVYMHTPVPHAGLLCVPDPPVQCENIESVGMRPHALLVCIYAHIHVCFNYLY